MGRTSLSLVLLVVACRAEPTQLIVVVDSDIAALQAVRIEVEGDDGRFQTNRFDIGSEAPRIALPFSFGVAPRRGTPAERQTPRIRVFAVDGAGTDIVERRVQVGFVKNKTLHLLMYLAEACRGVTCPGTQTCDRGVCVEEFIDPGGLEQINPDLALNFDAGPPIGLDASVDDAELTDTDGVDAPVALVAPQLFYPWNGVAVADAPEFHWQSSPGADEDEIQFGNECRGGVPDCEPATGGRTDVVPVGAGRTLHTVDGLTNERWFFRVRSCRAGRTECGPWSDSRYFILGRSNLDTDGNGMDDVLASAPHFGRDDVGAVFWYSTFSAPAVMVPSSSASETDAFGLHIAFVGDVDGDITPDFVIASRNTFELFHGARGSGPAPIGGVRSVPVWDVAGVGDVDGDGFADVGVATGAGFGIFHGPGALDADMEVDDPATVIAGLGDLDGDGLPEFAVGVPDENRIVVYRGTRDRTYPRLAEFAGPTAATEFGFAITHVGDIDGDSVSDVIVGAPDQALSAGGSGNVYVLSGRAIADMTATPMAIDVPPRSDLALGFALAQLQGTSYAIAGPGSGAAAVDGQVIQHDEGTNTTLPDGVSDARVGSALASGDYDGDGVVELIAGAPRGGGDSPGELILFEVMPVSRVTTAQIPVPEPDVGGLDAAFGELAQGPPSRLR